jgi:hypothetical protein
MVQEIYLMLLLIFVGNTEATQWAEPGVDAVNSAWLGCEGLDQFSAAAHEWPRFIRESAIILEHGNFPDFADGKIVSVELDRFAIQGAQYL